MNIGQLRHRVIIQEVVETQDTYGQATKSYNDLGTRYASISPVNGTENKQGQQINAQVTHKINMRYTPLVTVKTRLLFGNRVFNIISVKNKDERNLELEILASEAL